MRERESERDRETDRQTCIAPSSTLPLEVDQEVQTQESVAVISCFVGMGCRVGRLDGGGKEDSLTPAPFFLPPQLLHSKQEAPGSRSRELMGGGGLPAHPGSNPPQGQAAFLENPASSGQRRQPNNNTTRKYTAQLEMSMCSNRKAR